MNNKRCARCEKTVYPTEELKCLDKTWHKFCFKCNVCSMTLNMRNYKGFERQPYCEAHVPKAKATAMAETPELRRIAENTKLQSNVQYHADFEKAKGKCTQVADDPETLRLRQNSKIISNVAYHGELEKKAAMEQKRNISEDGQETYEAAPAPAPPVVSQPPPPALQTPPKQQQHHQPPPPQQPQQPQHRPGGRHLSDLEAPVGLSPYSLAQRLHQTLIYTSDRGAVTTPPQRQIGSIAELDPVNNYYGSLSGSYQQSHPPPSQPPPQQLQQQPPVQQTQHNNNISMNNNNNNMGHNRATPISSTGQRVCRAMYDYQAQDGDEVSFLEGDIITDCSPIDEGWMTGRVDRTGAHGMLPANYVTSA